MADEDPDEPVASRPSIVRVAGHPDAHLFYRGCLHWVFGPHSSGKTFVAQMAALDVMFDGGHVVVVDAEDRAPRWYERLLALGADRPMLDRLFHKVSAQAAVTHPQALSDTIGFWGARLLLIDGFNQAATLAGCDPNDIRHVASFIQNVALNPRDTHGVTIVVTDHVRKAASEDGRPTAPIGSIHKLNIVDGAAYYVQPVAAITRGRVGQSKLWLAKDRPGAVHAASNAHVGMLTVNAETPGVLTAQVRTFEATTGTQPSTLNSRILTVLQTQPDGLSQTRIAKMLKRANVEVIDALADLHEQGKVHTDVNRWGTVWKAVGPNSLHLIDLEPDS